VYVIAYIAFTNLQGETNDYEVGAEVEYVQGGNGWAPSYEVGEPEFSAPDCELKYSRLAQDPQGGDVFPTGWSDAVEERLVEAYVDANSTEGDTGPDPDEYADRDDGDYMYGED
jgi:hypothetical protein